MGKRILKVFIVSFFICCGIAFWFWGNFNLFGSQGFHLDAAVEGMVWGLKPSIFITLVIALIMVIKDSFSKKQRIGEGKSKENEE